MSQVLEEYKYEPEEPAETMCALPDEAFEIINEYNLACTAEKEAIKRKEAAKMEIVALLGNHQIGIWNDLKVSYVPQVRESIDTKRLQAEYPTVYQQYAKKTEFYTLRIGHIK